MTGSAAFRFLTKRSLAKMALKAAEILKAAFEFVEDKAGPVCLAVLMLILGLQVGGRAVGFGAHLTWTDEVCRILFVWSVFLSVPLASKHGAMVSIKLSKKLWPRPIRPYMPGISLALWSLTALFAALICFLNIMGHLQFPQLSPVLGLNQNHIQLVMPLAFIMVFIRGLFSFKQLGWSEGGGQ